MPSPPFSILAIDSATGPCSAAVWHEGRLAAYALEPLAVQQSARLMPMIDQVLQESGLRYHALSLVAATTGPGSFTGIRVGLAAARGIAYAAGKNGAGYSTLEVLADAAFTVKPMAQHVLALLNAGKGECYGQYFERSAESHGHPTCEPMLDRMEAIFERAPLGTLFCAGNVPCPAGANWQHTGIEHPTAAHLASLASRKASAGSLAPFYVRPPDAKLPAA